MEAFTSKAIQVIQNIPSGKVMTYGQIASHAGSPRGARQVARLLHSMSAKYDLPWHRVINAAGEISIQDENQRKIQADLLRAEGVEIKAARVDLNHYRFNPEKDAD
ncbi:MGMT family protein [Planococcus halotolerans]|uniref:DNA methyltransferase n=1 Tax=Planococcus halotolerans TaxID=2233542 RepID=A0A365L259_9BACL|nr:MGMT family protein [Planococcus halotolerans]RAZ79541.1 DNA methyltransferase [Planococcus halotolerans]